MNMCWIYPRADNEDDNEDGYAYIYTCTIAKIIIEITDWNDAPAARLHLCSG